MIGSYNNQIHLTVKSVTNFAIAKFPPLFTSSDLGYIIGRANARPITRRSVELSRTTGYRKSDNQ